MGKIGLFGASGAIGATVAKALEAEGQPYRVIGRSREALEHTFASHTGAEMATWDPADTDSIRAATAGVDTLVYTVGVPYNRFRLHPLLMRKTVDGAVHAGVQRILLIGTVYPYGRPVTPKVAESHPRNPHTYKGRMRKEQEDILLEAHGGGRIDAAILRLPDFYGPGVQNSFLHQLFQAAAHGGRANMVGPVDTPHEFVFVPDVGPVVVALAKRPEAYGRWWNLAGAGAITQLAIAEQAFALVGRKPDLRVGSKTALRLLGLFNPFMRELVEMHYLMTTPILLDDTALTRLLGPLHKTSYEEGITRTLAQYRNQQQ
jgi:nucleoside-diphosphate-sugar epimerase